MKKKILCHICDEELNNQISSSIKDYFKLSKNVKDDNNSTSSKSTSCSLHTQEPKLKLPRELKPEQKELLQRSIMKANLVKEINFNDDLCYPYDNCQELKNDSSLEPGIVSLSDYNKEIYYKFKERSKKGEYAPLQIMEDDIQVYNINSGFYSQSYR